MKANRCTILLIHGLWVTPLIWEPFCRFYENLGYEVLAPAWPGLEGDPGDMRRDPSVWSATRLTEVLAYYVQIIRSLSEPPVIMGHSYGGLITQLLGDQGLGVAAVVIAPIPSRGFPLRSLSCRLALLSVLIGSLENRGTVSPTFTLFWRKFCNSLPESNARRIYDAQVIPAPRGVVLQAALADFPSGAALTVNFSNPRRPPLLVIGGGADVITPGSLCRAIYRKHRASPRHAEYKEFPGRSHLLIAEQGWQEVASCALTWALTQTRA